MTHEQEDFLNFTADYEVPPTAAAILVLASAVREAGTFTSRKTSELFGHELAMALKDVLECSQVRIVREGE